MADDATVVEREVVLPVGRDEAWALVTEDEHLGEWLAPEVELDLRDGGTATFRWDDGAERHGVVEHVEDGTLLRFLWAPEATPAAVTEVEIRLVEVPEGTRVVVRESGFPGATTAAAAHALVARWTWEWRLGTLVALGAVAAV